jgi:hypothetical protein
MWVAGDGTVMSTTPSVTVELHNSTSPFASIESQTSTLSNLGVGYFTFSTAVNGTPYYIVIKSANTIETWSATAQSFDSSFLTYNFTTDLDKAFTDGSNPPLALHTLKYCIYSGDCNQDGYVTSDDFTGVDNDIAHNTFHLAYDLNGNGFITSDDFTFTDNNASKGVRRQVPAGAPAFVAAKQVIKSHVQQKSSDK